MQSILFWFKKNTKDLIFAFILLLIISFIVYDKVSGKENVDNPVMIATNLEKEEPEEVKEEEVIVPKVFNVDIKGAIKNPGVYALNEGAIINDVVKLAGGFNSNAYQSGINLSKKITDEMVIYVYTKTEINNSKKEDPVKENIPVCEAPTYNICECVDNKESVIETSSDTTNASSNTTNTSDPKEEVSSNNTVEVKYPININTADAQMLSNLNGIGESKALAIVQYRNEVGNFKTIEDILNVKGIGESVFAKIKDYITV